MSILQNGFFLVERADNGELYVRTVAGNGEAISSSETFKSGWPGVKTNIQAAIRATNGRFAIVVDDTLENLQLKRVYHRMGADGTLETILVQTPEAQEELDGTVATKQQAGAGSTAQTAGAAKEDTKADTNGAGSTTKEGF